MVSNEQSGAFSCTGGGGGLDGQGGGGGGDDFHRNRPVPSCHVWAEIGAVSIGTT